MFSHPNPERSLVTKLLSEVGEVAQLWPGYQSRVEQLALSQLVEQAIVKHRCMLIEAPTGTGKTLGYLLAAMTAPGKVIVSVGNRTMQDHLWWGEYQKLQMLLPDAKSMVVLKGCENYLCLNRIQQSLEGGELALVQAWEELNQWRIQTRVGDLQTLPWSAEKLESTKPLISTSAEQCSGKSCQYFNDCFFQKARDKAANAELLLINHSLLLSDQQFFDKGMGALLPQVEAVIVDEAHQLPDSLLRHNMDMIDGYRFHRWLTNVRRVLGYDLNLFKDLSLRLDQVSRVWQQIEMQLAASFASQDMLSVSARSLQPLLDVFIRLQQYLEQVQEALPQLKEYRVQLDAWTQMLARSVAEATLMYCTRSGKWMRVLAARLVSPFTGLETAASGWVFLSATLAVDEQFDYIRQSLNLPKAEEYRFKGAMDYHEQAQLWIPDFLPDPADEQFYAAWAETLLTLEVKLDGGMLLLFSSHNALQACAQYLQGRSQRSLLVYETGTNRQQLLRQFRQDQNSILLATGSFWEGIDVQGAALRCVAIDKLPFSPPDDLINLAWRHMAREQNRHWFNDFAVPQAVTRLRQGVGRLLRAADDCGLVVLGDNRMLRKAYGSRFLHSLPAMPRAHSLAEVEDFLERKHIIRVNA